MAKRDSSRLGLRRWTGAIILFLALLGTAHAAGQTDLGADQLEAVTARAVEIGIWGDELGQWRTKTELVFDKSRHQLTRQAFTIWDPAPSRNLDFYWTSVASGSSDHSSNTPIVSGEGHLVWRTVWRTRDWPTYDPRSFFAEYRGAM
jgi:hypothetical protein